MPHLEQVIIPKQHPLDIVRKAIEKMDSMETGASLSQMEVIEILAYLAAAKDVMGRLYDTLLLEVQRVDPEFKAHGAFYDDGGGPLVQISLEKKKSESPEIN